MVRICPDLHNNKRITAFGEEIEWRGFLQRESLFMDFCKFIRNYCIIWDSGMLHSFCKDTIIHSIQLHVHSWWLFSVSFFPQRLDIRIKAKSVIAAGTIHASSMPQQVVKGGNDLIIGVTGITVFAVIL